MASRSAQECWRRELVPLVCGSMFAARWMRNKKIHMSPSLGQRSRTFAGENVVD